VRDPTESIFLAEVSTVSALEHEKRTAKAKADMRMEYFILEDRLRIEVSW